MSWTRIQIRRDLGLTGQGAWSRRSSSKLKTGHVLWPMDGIVMRSPNGNWYGKDKMDEPCGVGWRARGEQGNLIVSQSVAGERKAENSAFTSCFPSCIGQEHRLGFPNHVFVVSAHVKASRKAPSPLCMLIHIKDDNDLLLSIIPLV